MLAADRVWFSGFVWLVANAVQYAQSTQAAFVVLLLGGMVIFPGSNLYAASSSAKTMSRHLAQAA